MSQRQRGYALKDGVLKRLEMIIEQQFPRQNFSSIYHGMADCKYNCKALIEQMNRLDSRFRIHPDTLRKILRRDRGVDESTLKMLFEFFGESFGNDDREVFAPKANISIRMSQRISLIQNPGCNLPRPPYTEFIGRQKQLEKLLHDISFSCRLPIIVIAGLGGIGKTSLALEAAYRCWESKHCQTQSILTPVFDAIIFVSARDKYLNPYGQTGFISYTSRQSSLDDIFRTIAETLEEPSINQLTGQEQIEQVYKSLSKQKTLLIVDDIHNMIAEEQERVISFLTDLPASTKALVTTRKNRLLPIRLEPLSKEESLQLIQQQADEKSIDISAEIANRIYQCFQGFPMAIIYAIGMLALGNSIESIVCQPCPIRQNIVQHCFGKSIQLIQGTPAHKLLMAIALFCNPPNKNAAIQVSGLAQEPVLDVEDNLLCLSQLSLVSQQDSRYNMLSITHDYVNDELKKHPDFEQEARERWVDGYIEFASEHGGLDWGDWHIKYDRIEAEWGNILSVFDWCAQNDRYESINTLWRHLNHFADLYGYWQDRIFWLDWLLEKSRELADRETTVYTLTKKLWTLTMMGKYEEAQETLAEAWSLYSHADVLLRDYLHHNSAVFHIRKGNFSAAETTLSGKEALIEQMNDVDERQIIRCKINTLRDRGKIALKQQQFEQADVIYKQVLLAANEIGWYRAYSYTCNILAKINLELGNFEVARNYLEEGLPIAERNRNKRRIAYYKCSQAKIAENSGDIKLIGELATEAGIIFNSLGMTSEIEEISNKFGICILN